MHSFLCGYTQNVRMVMRQMYVLNKRNNSPLFLLIPIGIFI